MKYLEIILFVLITFTKTISQEISNNPSKLKRTVWISPENINGDINNGGKSNKGAKGSAFITLKAGDTLNIMDFKGAGIINRIWLSGTIPRNSIQSRLIKIEMFWDNDSIPAVSVPISDFFGTGFGVSRVFENELFSSPEGRSFNSYVQMPFRKAAKIRLINESDSHSLIWYDINLTSYKKIKKCFYFHAYWNRETKTKLGSDYTILPKINGKGRFLGVNLSILGDSLYKNTWFGEGEVKMYLDDDKEFPSLVGTGTEDYIGSGWGQGQYANRYQGSLLSNSNHDIYVFYRYHIPDPIFFNKSCRITLQQIGNTSIDKLMNLVKHNPDKVIPTWLFKIGESTDIMNLKGLEPQQILLLETSSVQSNLENQSKKDSFFSASFYRSDDCSSTAYFYLNKTSTNLKIENSKKIKLHHLVERIWKHYPSL